MNGSLERISLHKWPCTQPRIRKFFTTDGQGEQSNKQDAILCTRSLRV